MNRVRCRSVGSGLLQQAPLLGLAGLLLASAVACGSGLKTVGRSSSPSPAAAPAPLVEPPREMPPSLALLADLHRMTFGHLPPDKGLSQSVVLDMVQDDQGFLWLGTQDGLNRYDGYAFRIYKDQPGVANSLRGNFVASLDKAPSGEIWVGTSDGGLSRYAPRSDRFTAYLHDPQDPNSLSEDSIASLDVDGEGIVWAGTSNGGLNRLDPSTGQVTRYQHRADDPTSLGIDNIGPILATPDGHVWVGTIGGGLDRLDVATGQFTHYRSNSSDPQTLGEDYVQSLYVDSQNVLWVGTFQGGLCRLDSGASHFVRYTSIAGDPGALRHSSVSAIFEDRLGRLWVGTQGGGLHLLDRRTGRFTNYRNNAADPSSPSNDSIVSIYEDSSGILWLGTFGSGADYYDPYKSKFVVLRSEPGNPEGLSSNSLWTILEDDAANLWVTTNDAGVNRFDPQNRTWRHYRHDPNDPTTLSHDTVFAVYEDRQGTLWFGTVAGLDRFDRQTGQFTHYATPFPLAIYEDSRGSFWLGSAAGLILFDRDTGDTQAYLSDAGDPTSLSGNTVTWLYEDAQGRFWVGTSNAGLNLFDRDAGRFARFTQDVQDGSSLSSNAILSILQARDGTLWVGTLGGLNRFDAQTGTSVVYREKDGLPNDVIYGILEDDQGHLWLSTNKGISRFDPRTGTCKNYDKSDGLPGNEYNQWSCFRNKEGVMFFGGVSGLAAFHPDMIQDNPFVPPIVITGMRIYQRPVTIGPDSPLQGPLEGAQALRLSYRDDFFEFDYAALHFSSPEEIRYAYILEGLDRGWNEVGNRHFASYTNVPPGEYVFRVKGTNSDGVWNDDGASLRIVIPPPFWQTTWFRALLALGVIGGMVGGFALRIHAVERQRQRLEGQVQERTRELEQAMLDLERSKEAAEAANRAKSTFLANMSHEFRTPLNAILGFTQIMTRDQRLLPDQSEDMQIIHRSSEHLLGLINDVLEMSKIEAGRTTLNCRGFDLHHMLQGLYEMFALRAESKGLALELDLAPDVPRYIRSDEGKLRQVLMNLLGNAVKFTQQGRVALHVQRGAQRAMPGESIRFAVEDTGLGIAPEQTSRLFVPFVQAEAGQQAQEGTGLGLAISQQYARLMGSEISVRSVFGQGSVFQFDLPVETIAAGDLEQPPLTRRVVGLEPGQPIYRMLVVDDQEVNRKLLLRLFQPLGFALREAANGKEALALWESWEPHLIWMDMRMPVMDGYRATREIKSTTRGMGTLVIALTASALEEDRAVILSEGCDDYIRKPFREDEIYNVVAKHLGVRYVYESAEPASSQRAEIAEALSPTAQRAPLSSRMKGASPDWLADLERAVILGDLQGIHQLADQRRDVAQEIIDLAEQFEHDRIMAAIQEAREASQQGEH